MVLDHKLEDISTQCRVEFGVFLPRLAKITWLIRGTGVIRGRVGEWLVFQCDFSALADILSRIRRRRKSESRIASLAISWRWGSSMRPVASTWMRRRMGTFKQEVQKQLARLNAWP